MLGSEEKIGIPFTFSLYRNDRNRKPGDEEDKENLRNITITINPKENKITDMIMTELSVVYEMAQSRHQTNILTNFADEFVSI